jgi:hypothetical protein
MNYGGIEIYLTEAQLEQWKISIKEQAAIISRRERFFFLNRD